MDEVTGRGILGLDDGRALFEHSPTATGLIVDGRFVQANRALADLLGQPLDDIIGMDAFDVARAFLPPDDFEEAVAAVQDGTQLLHLEGPVHRDDGERWVAVDVAIVDGGPAPTSIVTATDVTDVHQARAELAVRERRFRTLLTNISDTVSLTDAAGRIIYTSGAERSVLGYSAEEWAEMDTWGLLHPDDQQSAAELWASGLDLPGVEITSEVRMRDRTHGWQDISITGVNLLDDPDVNGVVITTRNITPLRRAERLASGQARVLELIARGAPLGTVAEACVEFVESNGVGGASSIYLLDGERLDLRAGRAPAALNAYLREPVRHPTRSVCDAGMLARQAVIAADLASMDFDEGLQAIARAEGLRAAWSQPILSISSGRPVGSLSTVFDELHEPTEHERHVADVACSLVAIALERVENEDRLAHQALHDALTGLPNRTLLLDRLDQALIRRERSGAQIAVLFCDIDRFKVVNDSLGHGVGDQLLVAFAERFRAAVGPTDTVARFGGDEFVVLVDDIGDDDAPVALAGRLAAVLQQPFLLPSGQEVHLTASIGLTYASDHTSGDAWLRDADAAMYRAKERGRNRTVLFDTEMRDAAVARLQVENDLRSALERDELVAHFQPVIDLGSGRIVGAEALVRWEHPTRGLLFPGEFIAVAEDTGLIEEVGRRMLDLAVGAAARLVPTDRVERFQIGVNVSAQQLVMPGLDELVARVCARHGWPYRSLLLEITESTLLRTVQGPIDLLTRVHELGVQLAIDDFGTGYSSIGRLGHLPVDQVKIDQSFVAAIGRPDDRLVRLVDAVTAIANALELRTTAEGVETTTQLDHLRRLGCDQAQGHLFSRAVPADRLAALLADDPRW